MPTGGLFGTNNESGALKIGSTPTAGGGLFGNLGSK